MSEAPEDAFLPIPGNPRGGPQDEGIALLDEAGTVLAADGALERMFGYGPGELEGLTLCRLIAGGAPCKFEKLRHPPEACAARTASAGRWMRVVGVRKGGEEFPFDMTAFHLPEGKAVAYTVVARDCGAREGTEALLRLQATALAAAANAIVITDSSGTILWVNPAFTRLTGYEPRDVLGKNPRILKSGTHPDSFFAGLWKAVTSGRVWKGETVNRKRDGSLYVEEQTITPVLDRTGAITHFVSIKNDITTRKHAEEALRDKSAKLAERVKELRCLYEVSELLRRTDLSHEKLLSETVRLLPSAWLVPEKTCARIVWEGQEFRTENFRESEWELSGEILVHGRRVGAVRVGFLGAWPEGGDAPFLPEERELIEAVAHLLGNSIERRRTEEALQASERQYRLVVENVREIIFRCDAQGRWVFLNQAWTELLGYTAEESLGRSFQEHVDPEDFGKAGEVFRLLATGERKSVRTELRGITKWGETRWYELVAVRLSDGDGNFEGTSGTIGDITRRKEVEQLKREFVSTVSHELRTPLTSIKGSLGLLGGGVMGPLTRQAEDLVGIALRNCDRLGLLINDLLDMEKIESGKMAFAFRDLELLPLVEQALDATSAYAEQFGVIPMVTESDPTLRVRVDPDRLVQVMVNLLSNAIKFSPKNRRVEVGVVRLGSWARVSVADHGPGISEEFRGRIFQKFAQADSSDTRKKGGTGLGLAISRSIVERLGGRMDFVSEVGAGTTFFFELPLLEADRDRASAGQDSSG